MNTENKEKFEEFVDRFHLVPKPDKTRTLYYFSCFGFEGILNYKDFKKAIFEFENMGRGCWKYIAREATVSDLERMEWNDEK